MQISAIIFVFALGLASLTSAYDVSVLKPRIVGGKDDSSKRFGFIGQLSTQIHGRHTPCIATLISPSVAITLGACIKERSSDPEMPKATVTFASPLTKTASQKLQYNVSRIEIQQSKDFPVIFINVALLYLDSPVPSTVATPVKIYAGNYSTQDTLTFAGYRKSDKDKDTLSNTLAWYNTTPEPKSVCDPHNNITYVDMGYALCTAIDKDSYWCREDLASPLLYPLGGNSFGLLAMAYMKDRDHYGTSHEGCNGNSKLDYHIRPALVVDWIAKALNTSASDISIDGKGISKSKPATPTESSASASASTSSSKSAGAAVAPELRAILGLAVFAVVSMAY